MHMNNEDLDAINKIMGKSWIFPKKEETMKEEYSEAASILRNGGKLSHAFTNYQERYAQIEMTRDVERAIMQQCPLVLEAATGTGKSLGYLVPVITSGRKAIISTSGKSLQNQLFDKDIPLLQKYVKTFEAALMKGKNSYLCLDRMHKYGMEPQKDSETDSVYRQVCASTDNPTFEGDFDKLGFYVKDDLKNEINVDGDQCAGGKCDFYKQCYFYKQRKKLETAQVVIVNHHLLLNDALSGERVLPPRDVIVIDEAHNLENDATTVFTTEIRKTRVTSLLKLKKLNVIPNDTRYAAQKQCDKLWLFLEQFFPQDTRDTTIPLNEPIEEGLHLASCLDEIVKELSQRKPENLSEKEGDLYDKMIKRAKNLSSDIRKVFSVDSEENVYYMKKELKGKEEYISVLAVPLDVSSFLESQLFEKNNTICVSATLATGLKKVTEENVTFTKPDFDYFRQRVGLTDERTIERILPLVFDYKRNAMLYIPNDLKYVYGKGKEAQNYKSAIGERMLELIQLSRGRAFLLFSSKDMMNTVYDQIAHRLSYPVLRQGDLPTPEIKSRFKEAGNAVLFGLKTFWEGVDIAGEALSLVIIDKLPNNYATDPVHAARRQQMDKYGNGYALYDIPQVITRLKQGVGRLIRTDTDSGIMAILDNRMGSNIRKALPPAVQTSNLQDVKQFFTRH